VAGDETQRAESFSFGCLLSFTLLVAGDSHRHRQPKARDFYFPQEQDMNKRQYAGNFSPHIFCEKCKAPLNIKKAVWLSLDQRSGKYTDQDIPEEFNQGALPFGKVCAIQAKAGEK
jgi:hypothetical protein